MYKTNQLISQIDLEFLASKLERGAHTRRSRRKPQAEGAAKLPRAVSVGSSSDSGEEFAVGYGSKAGVVRVEDDRIKGVRPPSFPPAAVAS